MVGIVTLYHETPVCRRTVDRRPLHRAQVKGRLIYGNQYRIVTMGVLESLGMLILRKERWFVLSKYKRWCNMWCNMSSRVSTSRYPACISESFSYPIHKDCSNPWYSQKTQVPIADPLRIQATPSTKASKAQSLEGAEGLCQLNPFRLLMQILTPGGGNVASASHTFSGLLPSYSSGNLIS